MDKSFASVELRTERTRVHVYSYRFKRRANHTRASGHDVLALCTDRVRSAEGVFRTPRATSSLLPLGDLIIVPADAEISTTGPGGERRLAVCTMLPGILPADFDCGDRGHLAMCGNVDDVHVRTGMRRLAAETMAPGFAADVLIDGLAAVLRVDIARYFSRATDPARGASAGVLAPWQLRRIEEFVRANEGQRIAVADLAGVAAVSAGHLMRTFKKSTGQTVHQFVGQVRLDRARVLLHDTSLPLKQVAARLGFAGPSSFSLAFRRATGLTPGQFRRASGPERVRLGTKLIASEHP